jgi:hypothetical protein
MARSTHALMGLGLSIVALALPAGAQAQNMVKAQTQTEVKLERQIDTRLAQDNVLRGKGITVDVRGDTAILGGRVASEGERERADQVARVAGVQDVDNQIVVVPPPATQKQQAEAAQKQQAEADKAEQRARYEAARQAQSDPRRIDPMVGTAPFETLPKDMRLRTMGMPYVPADEARTKLGVDAGAR